MKKVLVGGCFDFIHYGHISFLKKAKSYGTYLVVALESDENVKRAKGINRPIHNQVKRKEMLESLSFVDEVIVLQEMKTDEDYDKLVKQVKPDVVAVTKGDPIKKKKEQQADLANAQLVEIEKIHTPSTTQLAKLLGLE